MRQRKALQARLQRVRVEAKEATLNGVQGRPADGALYAGCLRPGASWVVAGGGG